MLRFFLISLLTLYATGGEMLQNGDFRRGVQGWRFNKDPSYEHCFPKVTRENGQSVVTINVPQVAKATAALLVQDVTVENDRFYELSVDLRMEAEEEVQLVCKQRGAPWKANGLFRKVTPTKRWQRFVMHFKGTNVDPENPPVFRIDLGLLKGKVHIRNCSLKPLDNEVNIGNWGGKLVKP